MTSITVLGCGASSGVPVLGCSCSVCLSSDSKNRRRRTGLLIKHEGRNLLIDASPDLRDSLLSNNLKRLDGICLTHHHFDHIGGLIDLRSFCNNGHKIPCLLSTSTLNILKYHSLCVWEVLEKGIVSFSLREILHTEREVFDFAGFPPIHCSFHEHGNQQVTSYRFGTLAFVTDVAKWNDSITELLSGAEIAFIGTNYWRKVVSGSQHTSIEEILDHVGGLNNLKQIYFMHLSHVIDFNKIEYPLGDKAKLAWDGLRVGFSWNESKEL
ncbi:MBL fold metallo-hydrolase [Candidatus Similichlamydia epinepheli]|uniref:MBL fold metallo-hydrolase n=1 Tax=Candidatus Similichlamydia epinepheli TaxID=1903953 RepID=UPI001300B0EE|nr:MBL fold metallo-hydrolase [Candidatus Similichlamydia epinepheli]